MAAVLPNPIKYDPTGNQKYVKNRSRIIYKIMQRRGIVIPEYKEVMTPPKEETSGNESAESNGSVLDLFGTQDAPASPEAETPVSPAVDEANIDTNGSLTF